MDNIFSAIIMVLIALVALLWLAYLEIGRSQSEIEEILGPRKGEGEVFKYETALNRSRPSCTPLADIPESSC